MPSDIQRFRLDFARSAALHDEAVANGSVWVEGGPCAIFCGPPGDHRARFEIVWSDGFSRIFETEEEARAFAAAHGWPEGRAA